MGTRVIADERYGLVLRMEGPDDAMSLTLLGYDDNATFVPIGAMARDFREHFAQITAPEDRVLTWVPDVFRLL